MKKIRLNPRYSIVIALCFCVAACEPEFDVQGASNVTDSPILFQALGLDVPTKAVDVTTDNLTSFEATAYPKGTSSSPYFAAATFTGSGNPKVFSASGVNWSNTALDIYAYSAGSATGQLTKIDYKTFTVTPAATAASQMDFVFGCLKGQYFAGTVNGLVPMNFRHAESKVCVNVKNSSSKYRFEVYGWKVCHLDNSATFTHDGSDTRAAGQLPYSCWSNNSSPSVSNSYESNFSALSVATSTFAPVGLSGEMMLIPQTTSAATAYQSTSASALPNGSYVAIKMKVIMNSSDAVIFSDGSGGGAWAIWPIGFNWTPGERFTYTIDLSKGAYHEANPISGESSLMSVNDVGLGITVSVGDFNVQEAINLPEPLPSFGGFAVTPAPLYYNGNNFIIREEDSWTSNSYQSIYGLTAGSYYFNLNQVSGIENIRYGIYRDWRLPTQAEWAAIAGTSRIGATINGVSGRHYCRVDVTGANLFGSTNPTGYLFFPDGFSFTDVPFSNYNNYSKNTATADVVNDFIQRGCLFLPCGGIYSTDGQASGGYWNSGGGSGYYWSSTSNRALFIRYSGSMNTNANMSGSKYWFLVRLVRPVSQ